MIRKIIYKGVVFYARPIEVEGIPFAVIELASGHEVTRFATPLGFDVDVKRWRRAALNTDALDPLCEAWSLWPVNAVPIVRA
jgi:hypothetical protein